MIEPPILVLSKPFMLQGDSETRVSKVQSGQVGQRHYQLNREQPLVCSPLIRSKATMSVSMSVHLQGCLPVGTRLCQIVDRTFLLNGVQCRSVGTDNSAGGGKAKYCEGTEITTRP